MFSTDPVSSIISVQNMVDIMAANFSTDGLKRHNSANEPGE
jgi:hypothetical protein